MRLIMVRHGESVGNVDESAFCRIPDHTMDLTPTGVLQAQQTGARLRELLGEQNIDVFVSPYRRTRQTLEHLQLGELPGRPHVALGRRCAREGKNCPARHPRARDAAGVHGPDGLDSGRVRGLLEPGERRLPDPHPSRHERAKRRRRPSRSGTGLGSGPAVRHLEIARDQAVRKAVAAARKTDEVTVLMWSRPGSSR
jgi:hypothetical protein